MMADLGMIEVQEGSQFGWLELQSSYRKGVWYGMRSVVGGSQIL